MGFPQGHDESKSYGDFFGNQTIDQLPQNTFAFVAFVNLMRVRSLTSKHRDEHVLERINDVLAGDYLQMLTSTSAAIVKRPQIGECTTIQIRRASNERTANFAFRQGVQLDLC